MINIVLADDHSLFRKGIKMLIDDLPDLQVVGEVASGNELLSLLKNADNRSDVILMDLNMPGLNGIEATAMVRKEYPDIKIIALTIYDDEQFIIRMVEKGADGYLFKNAEIEEVAKAIRDVMTNGFYFNETMRTALRKGALLKNKTLSFKTPIHLTARELEILQLICNELTATEIAKQLYISNRTVDGHRQKLLEKTGARNTAGLVIYAVKKGLLNIKF